MRSWDCATCSQRLRAICGTVGYLGGEIVSGYLLGGSVAVTAALTKAAAKVGAVAAAKVIAVVPGAARATEVATLATHATIDSISHGYQVLKGSKVVHAVIEVGLNSVKAIEALPTTTGLLNYNHTAHLVVSEGLYRRCNGERYLDYM